MPDFGTGNSCRVSELAQESGMWRQQESLEEEEKKKPRALARKSPHKKRKGTQKKKKRNWRQGTVVGSGEFLFHTAEA